MRSRIFFFAFVFTAVLVALPHLAHAAIPFFGHIIPDANNTCAAGWGMILIVINNIISFLLTIAIVFVAPVMIAYAGFLYVVNPMNPSGISKAKDILLNTIIGIVVALAGWLIVDAIMAVLYNPTAVGGTWSSLVTSGGASLCLKQEGALQLLDQSTGATLVGINGNGVATLSFGTGACDASVLQQVAPSLTSSQANTLACLAKPESTCGSVMQNSSWNKATSNGKASTAYGAFQVTLSGNHSCFETQACYTAAEVAGPLNCQKGFGANGFTAGGNATTLANCMKAASNLACNTAAAACVLKNQGYSAWTADPKSSTQAKCIAKYSSS